MSKKNKLYYCIITFDEPRGGPINVPAANEEEATSILTEQYGHLKGFKIIKVVDPDDVESGKLEQFETYDKPETIN